MSVMIGCSDVKPQIELSTGSSVTPVGGTGATTPVSPSPPGGVSGDIKKEPPPAVEEPATADKVPAEAGAPSLNSFALSSDAFKNLQSIPQDYKDTSPPLNWQGAPSGTGSYAIQMVDVDVSPPLILWTISNIPLESTKIPAGIEGGNNLLQPKEAAGADQANAYVGLDPSVSQHRIELTIYAVVPSVGLKLGKDSAANKAELESKSVGKSVLYGIAE